MHIKVLIIDKEALADCCVTVFVSLQVKLDLICLERALISCDHLSLICKDSTAMPIFLLLQPLDDFLR